MFDMKTNQKAVDEAVMECFEYGRHTGKEKGILLDAQGRRVHEVFGDENHIEWKGEDLLKHPGGLIVHDHPSGNSLSIEDLICAGHFGLDILAVGVIDGSTYWTNFDDSQNVLKANMPAVEELHFMAQTQIYPLSSNRASSVFNEGHGLMRRWVTEIAAGHEMMWEIGRRIMPWMGYSFRLQPSSVKAVEEWNRIQHAKVPTQMEVSK